MNKFEDRTVAYTEEKMTSGKIKKFIQENMWVPFYTLFEISWLHYILFIIVEVYINAGVGPRTPFSYKVYSSVLDRDVENFFPF